MTKTINKHWMSGGTGLTNFGREQFPIYQAAVSKYGRPDIWIEKKPMGGPSIASDYSLHSSNRNASEFWAVFADVRKQVEGLLEKLSVPPPPPEPRVIYVREYPHGLDGNRAWEREDEAINSTHPKDLVGIRRFIEDTTYQPKANQ